MHFSFVSVELFKLGLLFMCSVSLIFILLATCELTLEIKALFVIEGSWLTVLAIAKEVLRVMALTK